MTTWQCINGCGACCYLEPAERPDLGDYLTDIEMQQYVSMVGSDGWCINFDKLNRQCRIYAERPRFCRVEQETFYDMFGVEPEDLDEFAIDCCEENIESVYGDRSIEILKFRQAIISCDTDH